MPAYKGTKELPKPANKQARDMFTSMQKDREAMAKGRPDSVQRGEKGEGASMKKMKKGGMADKAGRALVKKSADTMGRAMKKCSGGSMKKYAGGGLVGGHKSADGIATKGKTKGKVVKMAMGGMPTSLGRGPVNMNPTQSGSGNTGVVMGANRPMAMGSRMGVTRKKGGKC